MSKDDDAEVGSVVDVLNAPDVGARLLADRPLLEKVTRALDEETDVKRLEEAFLNIARDKQAVEIFTAMAEILGPEKKKIVFRNVTAIFGNHFKTSATGDLNHLLPIVTEGWAQNQPTKENPEQ